MVLYSNVQLRNLAECVIKVTQLFKYDSRKISTLKETNKKTKIKWNQY